MSSSQGGRGGQGNFSASFNLIQPAVVAVGSTSDVEVHFSYDGPTDNPVTVVAGESRTTIPPSDLEPHNNIAIIPSLSANNVGILELWIESSDREHLSETAAMIVLPPQISAQLNQLYEESLEVVMNQDENQCASLTTVKHVAWGSYFQNMVKDMAQVLGQCGQNSGEFTEVSGSLHRLLAYLLQNRTYEAAEFLLRTAVQSGLRVTFDGAVLTEGDINFESLQKRFGSPPAGP